MSTVRHELDRDRRNRELTRLGATIVAWLAQHSVTLLRLSLGLVFLIFGALKFMPGLSPAQDLAVRTVETLTFGIVPSDLSRYFVAGLETTIGVILLTGWRLRVGVGLLGLAMIGILAPLVLFPDRLFGGTLFAPTLEAQYVLKDIVLLAAGLVVAATAFGTRTIGDDRIAPRIR